MMKQRLRPEVRRDQILAAAVAAAKTRGYKTVTRDNVALRADCSPALISRYFKTMVQLRRAIMREAIRTCEIKIIAEGIVHKNPYAMRAPADLRNMAIASLST